MPYLYLVPEWFFGLSIALEIIFAIAAATVAYYSYKIYSMSQQRGSRVFAIAFVFIAISYLVKASINWFLISEVKEGMRELSFGGLNMLGNFGIYAHIVLFLAGLVTLSYTTFGQRNRRMFLLLLALAVVPVFLSNNVTVMFNLVSSILTLYIASHYVVELLVKNNKKAKLTTLAFVFLFFSGISFIFAPDFYVDYVIGHLLELCSYVLIITSLVLTIRKK